MCAAGAACRGTLRSSARRPTATPAASGDTRSPTAQLRAASAARWGMLRRIAASQSAGAAPSTAIQWTSAPCQRVCSGSLLLSAAGQRLPRARTLRQQHQPARMVQQEWQQQQQTAAAVAHPLLLLLRPRQRSSRRRGLSRQSRLRSASGRSGSSGRPQSSGSGSCRRGGSRHACGACCSSRASSSCRRSSCRHSRRLACSRQQGLSGLLLLHQLLHQ